ncbi:MAG: glycosyltransferase family 2 protein [Verrucomicrobia bacterium]|nr:glycosyltransferase family 2 protein [Verrucomicrobiota bacterium]
MISITILTKNCEQTLRPTLESLKDFSEVILLDTGSVDSTLEIAKEFPNVRVVKETFIGFGPTHNVATAQASHDWILSIDSDEVLSKELVYEIQQLKLDENQVYSLNRKNFFNKKWIKWCGGWHPDRVVRLYHRKKTHFTDAQVHEKIVSGHLQVVELNSPLFHTPYRNMGDFLSKMQTYSTLFAEQNRLRKSSSVWKAVLHGWQAFIKSYFFKRGFLGGKEGFIISIYNGHTAFYKYLKLMEANERD